MKNQFKKIPFVILLFALALSGCWDDDDDDDDSSFSIVTATETEDYEYSSDLPIFTATPKTLKVNISDVPSGKGVYLAKVNTGSAIVKADYQRAVKEVKESSISASASVVEDRAALSSALSSSAPEGGFRHFRGEEVSLGKIQKAARSASSFAPTVPSKAKIYSEGNTRSIAVDSNVNMNSYKWEDAKLLKKGTYCYVWAIESDYSKMKSSDRAKTLDFIATTFQETFDEIYPIERNVFGEESNKLINSYSNATKLSAAAEYNMSSNSDTGEMINIVIYDIGADYNSTNQCGVLGYFYAKDYFTRTSGTGSVVDYSNQGKYFYIDAYYAVTETNTTISTLVHEFQHMINYGVKDIKKDITPDTAYNEMLSMLCEDMMAKHLDLDDDENVKAERLPYFNTSYFLSGIREYRNDGYAALSYSTSYGFGSWLCRQYGGAALVKEIMSNDYVDNDSLVAAVNKMNGKNYSFDDLFKQFLIACTNGGAESGYTHNRNAAQTETYGTGDDSYKYPMTAIDLWGDAYKYPVAKKNEFLVSGQAGAAYNANQSSYTGPFLWNNDYAMPLRPEYGILLYQLGTTSGDKLSLTFSDSGADCVTMYVIVQ